jgi:hypothetical protein
MPTAKITKPEVKVRDYAHGAEQLHTCLDCGSSRTVPSLEVIVIAHVDDLTHRLYCREMFPNARGFAVDCTNADAHFPRRKADVLYFYVDNGMWAGRLEEGRLFVGLNTNKRQASRCKILWRGMVPRSEYDAGQQFTQWLRAKLGEPEFPVYG